MKPTGVSAPFGSSLLQNGGGQGAPRSVALNGQGNRLADALSAETEPPERRRY
ncbi:hypothetical protein GGE65_004580 [Skermanella aerolata]|uniref:Uncharacterized protein n=1 Tax=Skermanella aerolata TaxID=393310 RepID=A0A512E1E0_9PROT|nr:hypothetical protein [Skermanella aerolata]KJB91026.1 hypothetical protein N826_33810 [Skermanella aerolata KACC 11604]GEO42529.1 hypothetical protein SAE02_66770 [Skermanella aerolata]